MNEKLANYIKSLSGEISGISKERKIILDEIKAYVGGATNPKLNFICTHNSRRSHLSQIWAQTMANFFGEQIETFSGGTEATAFNPNAVEAVKRAGFSVKSEGEVNPRYHVYFDESKPPMACFSKKFDESPNPTSYFAAIMTCSEADAECPVVFGADQRIKLFYEDPKISDGTAREAETYDARCRQIATEMYYVFQK